MAKRPKPVRGKTADVPPKPATAPRTGRASTTGIKVEATETGYYDHTRRRVGDVFTVKTEQEFSAKWMRRVDASTRERTTSPNQAIALEHDEILGGRVLGQPQPGIQVGPDNVPADLPTGEHNPLGDD